MTAILIFGLVLLLSLTTTAVDGFSSASSITSASATRTITIATGDFSRRKREGPSQVSSTICYSGSLYQDPPTIDTINDNGFGITPLSDGIRKELQSQNPNEDAPAYDFYRTGENGEEIHNTNEDARFRSMITLDEDFLKDHKNTIGNNHFEMRSLDDLFPEQKSLRISEKFNSCAPFRNGLRDAIRHDMIFDSNADRSEAMNNQPRIYGSMTDEERYGELARNKPLIGYWKHDDDEAESSTTATSIRMEKTTGVLRQYLGTNAPTGNSFVEAIGSLCNSTQTPYHWTEVVGVAATQNKQMGDKTDHAWHQDYGHLQDRKRISNKTPTREKINNTIGNSSCERQDDSYPYQSNSHVFFAFPYEDNYDGTGVFSHIMKLKHEQWAKPQQALAPGKSIFYRGTVPEQYIVRPRYVPGRELLIFRDIDVLHSSPDIQYRTSIMRFG